MWPIAFFVLDKYLGNLIFGVSEAEKQVIMLGIPQAKEPMSNKALRTPFNTHTYLD